MELGISQNQWTNKESIAIDISFLNSGSYLIRLRDHQKVGTKRFVVL